jgi:hypothetical protein
MSNRDNTAIRENVSQSSSSEGSNSISQEVDDELNLNLTEGNINDATPFHIPSSRRWRHLNENKEVSLSGYVTLHDFSKLLKPTHRNPLIADKG